MSFLFLLPGLSACACSPARTSYGGAAAREMEHRCQVGPSQQYAGLSSGDQTRAPRPHSRGVQARAGRRPAGLSSRGAPGPVGLVGWSGVAAAPRRSCCGAAVSNSSGGKLKKLPLSSPLFPPVRGDRSVPWSLDTVRQGRARVGAWHLCLRRRVARVATAVKFNLNNLKIEF